MNTTQATTGNATIAEANFRVVFTDTTETFVRASSSTVAMAKAVRQQRSHGRDLVASRAERLTKLIEKDSHLYKRRLVNEIRDTFARCGVYYTDSRGHGTTAVTSGPTRSRRSAGTTSPTTWPGKSGLPPCSTWPP